MKIAFTHNLRLSDTEEEAEFDTPETIEAVATALACDGNEVQKIEVSGPASHLAARLEAFSPDLIFNTAEGKRGRSREAFYPALFEELGITVVDADVAARTVVEPGTRQVIRLPVTTDLNGAEIAVYVHAIRGKKPGPTLALTTAQHGDEWFGPMLFQHLIPTIDENEID